MKKVSFKESFEGGQCCSASDVGRKTVPHFGCSHRESTIANRGQTGAWHHKLRSRRRPQAPARRDVSDVMEIGGEVVRCCVMQAFEGKYFNFEGDALRSASLLS
jgi:hypothetical protein